MATLTELVQQRVKAGQASIGAVSAFTEYVHGALEDLRTFIQGDAGVLSLPIAYDSAGNAVNRTIALTQQQYQDCIAATVSTITAPINDVGSTITLTADTIVQAVEDQAAELKVQTSFLDYCLDQAEVTASEFITRTRSLATNVSSEVIEKYSRYISLGGSPIEALRGFFATMADEPSGASDSYVTMTNLSDYVGNPWIAALTKIANGIVNFFSALWSAIKSLFTNLDELRTACQNALKWVCGLLFGNLLTVYEKASGAPAGIMDLPVLQVYWSSDTELENAIDALALTYQYLYATNGYKQRRATATSSDVKRIILASVKRLCKRYYDGRAYASITEILVPANPFNLSIRVGRSASQQFVCSLYFVADYATWSKFSDEKVQQQMIYSLLSGMMQISSIVPMSLRKETDNTIIPPLIDIIEQVSSFNQATAASVDWSTTLQAVNVSLASCSTNMAAKGGIVSLVVSTLLYACVMSTGFINSDAEDATDVTDWMLQNYLFASAAYTDSEEEISDITGDGASFDVSVINSSVFRPYTRENLLPTTIHYQTISEQSHEIVGAITGVLVAVVVVIAVVKFTKWKSKRRAQTALAHGNADRLSWLASEQPTQENLEAFNSAFNKARRMDIVNGLLGLSGESSSSGLMQSALKGVVNAVSKLSGKESTDNVSLDQAISGVGGSVSSLGTSVNNNIDTQMASIRKVLK